MKAKWRTLNDSMIGNMSDWMLMTLVLLWVFAFGANGLNADVIWLDELYSVSNMGAFDGPYSPAQIMDSLIMHSPNQVPLYYMLGAGWAQLAGWSQFSLRFLSLATGVLMIAWLYRFGMDVFNHRIGLVAAFLMATSACVIWYFHELRMYTLLMLLAIAHSWLYWRLAHDFRTTRLTWCLFVATALALVYTHVFAMTLLIGLGVYHLLLVPKSRRWLNVVVGWSIAALLFLPYAPSLLDGLSYHQNKSLPVPSYKSAKNFVKLVVNDCSLLWLPLILSSGYAILRKRSPAMTGLLSITLIMILVLSFVNWHVMALLGSRIRYLLLLWFPFIILFAYGLTSAPRWTVITVLFLWGIAGYQLSRSSEIILHYAGATHRILEYPPLHKYIYDLKDKTRYSDFIVGFADSSRLNHAQKHGWSTVDYYLKVQLDIDGVFIDQNREVARLQREIRKIRDEYHPYLLFTYNPEDKPPNLEAILDIIHEDYIPCTVIVDKPDLQVQRYVNPVLDCEREEYAPITYDNGIRVVDRFARYVPESEVLQILTSWEVPNEQMLEEYNVSMQIITPDWRNVRQTDRHLYDNLLPWNVIELSTKGLPSGDYRLMIILYHRDSGEKVEGVDLATGEAGKILPILTFTIGS